jgi:hypothetical protein
MVAAGFSRPSFCSSELIEKDSNAILQRREEAQRTKRVSVATIKTTSPKIRRITPMRRNENISRRKRKANRRTKVKDEDLHIAGVGIRLDS